MKLPSINYLYQQAKNSAFRFPLTLISALFSVIIGIYLAENEGVIKNLFPYINTMLCLALGIPLFFCINVFGQKLNLTKIKTNVARVIGGIIIILLYFTLPHSEETANTSLPYIRYAIYNLSLHLLVSFAPYLRGKQFNGFWQYNRILFTRLIVSVIYSGFLYVGIALALVSLKLLFEIKIHETLYLDLWITIVGFFNTWFFISGIPKNFDDLDAISEYPFGLKVFSQYILLPLLLLYLIILYLYGAKIIVLWDWPKGVVSWLIIAVAVLGIFAFLLIHPYGQRKENSWIKTFSKAYYFALLPLVVMLFIAINMRILDYGITINRYIIILLGIWLTLVSGYFIIGKNNIKFIPISLCVMMLLMSFGPWSMFSVSERSQANRLEQILTEHGILKDGKVQNEQPITIDSNYYHQEYKYPNAELVSDSINNEIKSIIDYMDDFHGFNAMKDWYIQDFDLQIETYNTNKKSWNRINEAEIYMRALGLQYKHFYGATENTHFSYSTLYKSRLTEIKNYDYLINIDYYYYNDDTKNLYTFELDSNNYEIKTPKKLGYAIEIKKNDQQFAVISLKKLKDDLIKKYGKIYTSNLSQDELVVIGENEQATYKFELQDISFRTKKGKVILDSVKGKLMFRFKENEIIE